MRHFRPQLRHTRHTLSSDHAPILRNVRPRAEVPNTSGNTQKRNSHIYPASGEHKNHHLNADAGGGARNISKPKGEEPKLRPHRMLPRLRKQSNVSRLPLGSHGKLLPIASTTGSHPELELRLSLVLGLTHRRRRHEVKDSGTRSTRRGPSSTKFSVFKAYPLGSAQVWALQPT